MHQTRENYEQRRVKIDIVQGVGTQNKTSRMKLPAGRANTLALKVSEVYYLPMSKDIVVCFTIS